MSTTTVRDVPFSLTTDHRDAVVDQLQCWLDDLVDLSLRLKQAHWNLRGPRFLSIHEQLDEILETVRDGVDDVAERIVTLGAPADGRATRVASESSLREFPNSTMTVKEAIDLCCRDIAAVISKGRTTIDECSDRDPISEDLAIAIVGPLEKHHWMLEAQHETSD